MRYDSILDTIHRTPLVRLQNLSKRYKRDLFLKMESTGPGGSMKDRVALHCINQAEARGLLRAGSTVIESSSGSLGVSLAIVCARKGYKFICVLDPKVTTANRKLMQFYGAEITIVEDADETGNFLAARLAKVKELLTAVENTWWFNQYENPDNPTAHYLYTAPEIYDDMEGDIQWVVCPVGTGGLVAGVAKYFRERLPLCKIMAVDACGSVVLKGQRAPRHQVGIGSNRPSEHIDFSHLDACIYVNDAEAFECTHLLAREESILMGCSTGSTLAGVLKAIDSTSPGDNVVILGADDGLKYMDTVYDADWFVRASQATTSGNAR